MIRIITKIESEKIKIPEFRKLLGKDVEIIIRELKKADSRSKWELSKKISLNGALDNTNIREMAYE